MEHPYSVGDRVEYCLDAPDWIKLHGSKGTITLVEEDFKHEGPRFKYLYRIVWDKDSLMDIYDRQRKREFLNYYNCAVKRIPSEELPYDPKQQGDKEDDI